MLRHRADGTLIHRTALISTARQNGKSIIVRSIIGWLLDPAAGGANPVLGQWRTVLAAGHDAKQARLIYRGVMTDLQRIERLTKKPPRKYGERADWPPVRLSRFVGIERDGLFFDTITSEPGSIRGQSAGLVAYDEILTQRDWDMYEAVSPLLAAQPSPLLLMTSTAGHLDSVVLRSFYDRLRRQAQGDEAPDPAFYGAWWESGDPDAQLDWTQIRQANPALGDGRLTRDAIKAEYAILPASSWRRERLNHWLDVRAESAFNPGVWAACRVDRPLDGYVGAYSLACDVAPDWSRATITAAGIRSDGRVAVEVYRDLRGTREDALTADRLVAEIGAFPDPVEVIAYDAVSGAAARFRRDAEETGRPWDELKPGAVVAACMDVSEMILAGRLAVGDPLIDAQIPTVARKGIGSEGMFRFSRQHSAGPIDAVMAMTFAAHAAVYAQRAPTLYIPKMSA
jgi:hypothetical protein